MTSSIQLRSLVLEAAGVASEVMARPEVEQRWDEPSALDGMTVGSLAAHLVRATGATLAYLDRTDPDVVPDGDLLTPTTYFHFAVDSPIHSQIRDVSASESEIGFRATIDKFSVLLETMAHRFDSEPEDRLVAALQGRLMTLDDFCRTRLIEILLHLEDLAVSVGLERPPTNPAATAIVVDIVTGIARHVHGDWTVLHALARKERCEAEVFPVF